MTVTNKIEVGAPAPAFTLEDQDGAEVRSKDLAGKWVVLYFYPRDDTPGCTTEAVDFTAHLDDFQSQDAVVLGCSPDTKESHASFCHKHRLAVTLLSDPEHEVMEAYGAWGEKVLYGRKSVGTIRSTVLIDPSGSVAHHWRRVSAKGHAAAVLAKLQSLRADTA